MALPDVVLLEVADRVATVTLNRPDARNALSGDVLRLLPRLVGDAEADDGVDVIVLTGADPAFCAGLDLKEVGVDGGPLRGLGAAPTDRPPSAAADDDGVGRARTARGATLPATSKPLIGAINGVTVTGGLELALHCDFLIASERARFADTHARVGVHPLWGLTVLLPQAIGVRRARQMSLTGNFIDAATALEWGLVNQVVPHDELLPTVYRLAADIVSNDQAAAREILGTYNEGMLLPTEEALHHELRRGLAWQRAMLDPGEVERRRRAVVDRGRSQR